MNREHSKWFCFADLRADLGRAFRLLTSDFRRIAVGVQPSSPIDSATFGLALRRNTGTTTPVATAFWADATSGFSAEMEKRMRKAAGTKPIRDLPVQQVLRDLGVALRERAWRVELTQVPTLAALELPADLGEMETPIGALVGRAIQANIPAENEQQVALLKHFGLHASTRSISSQPARRQRARDHLGVSKDTYNKLLKLMLDDTARTLLMLQPGFEFPATSDPAESTQESTAAEVETLADGKPTLVPVDSHDGAGQLFIINGPSGVSITKALRKYKESASNRDVVIVSVEDHLCKHPLIQNVIGARGGHEPAMIRVLQLPQPVLTAAWPEALANALRSERVKERLLEGATILLTFHAVLYHLESGRFLIATPPDTLRHALEELEIAPDKVITLIDDVFDCHVRLMENDQVWYGDYNLKQRLGQIATMLEWRQIELRASQAIAKAFGISQFLFATKHPVVTFDKLLHESVPKYTYVAHPIGELRRLGLKTARAQEVMAEIERISSRLRERPDVILFEPTTIDELRFDWPKESEDEEEFIWPDDAFVGIKMDEHYRRDRELTIAHLSDELLTPKQIAIADQWMRLAPTWESGSVPHSARTQADQAGYQKDGAMIVEARGLQEFVMDEILRQVNWRDRSLIEQSSSLVQVRPFLKDNGACSSGVVEEHRLHRTLFKLQEILGQRRFRAVVFHPPADERRRRAGAVVALCHAGIGGGEVTNLTQPARDALMDALVSHDLTEWPDMEIPALGQEFDSILAGLSDHKLELKGGKRKSRSMGIRGVKVLRTAEFRDALIAAIQTAVEGRALELESHDLSFYRDKSVTELIEIDDPKRRSGDQIVDALDKEWESR